MEKLDARPKRKGKHSSYKLKESRGGRSGRKAKKIARG